MCVRTGETEMKWNLYLLNWNWVFSLGPRNVFHTVLNPPDRLLNWNDTKPKFGLTNDAELYFWCAYFVLIKYEHNNCIIIDFFLPFCSLNLLWLWCAIFQLSVEDNFGLLRTTNGRMDERINERMDECI